MNINTSGSRFVHTHSYYTPTFTRKSKSPVSTAAAILPSTASSTATRTTTGGTYPSTANITNPTSAQTLLLTAQNSSGSFVDNSQYSRSLTSYNTVTTEAGVPN